VVSALLSRNYAKKFENLNTLLPWVIGIISQQLAGSRKSSGLRGEDLINAVIQGLEEEAGEIIKSGKSSREDIFKAEVLKKVVDILKKQVTQKKGTIHRVSVE